MPDFHENLTGIVKDAIDRSYSHLLRVEAVNPELLASLDPTPKAALQVEAVRGDAPTSIIAIY